MALLFADAQTADGVTVTVPRGVNVGHVLLTRSNLTFKGTGLDCIISLDGTYNTGFRAEVDRGGYTLENLTIDVNAIAGIAAAVEVNQHTPVVTVRNVKILDNVRGTQAIDQRGTFLAEGLIVIGAGGAILHRSTAVSTTVNGMDVVGGQYVFQMNEAGAGINLRNIRGRFDYWALPTYESPTVIAYEATRVLATHVVDDRSSGDILRYLLPVLTFDSERTLRSPLVRRRDRVEVAGVGWTQVLGFGPDGSALLDEWRAWGSQRPIGTPSATATVYRVVLGRVIYSPAGELNMKSNDTPPSPRWRYAADGSTAPTPTLAAGSRLDLIRHGGVNRDTDSGAVNLGDECVSARLANSTIVGGASDQITAGGVDTVITGCLATDGHDENFTLRGGNGRVTLRRCQATRAGRTGFHLNDGPSDLYSCTATDNGVIDDGSGDYGASTTSDCIGSTLQVRGSGNRDGLLGGSILTATPGGWERPDRSNRRRREFR